MNIIQYNAEQIPQKYSQIFNLPFQITEGTKVAYDFVHKKLKLRYFEPLVHTGTSSRKLPTQHISNMDTVMFSYTTSGFAVSLLQQQKTLYEHINLAVLNLVGYIVKIVPALRRNSGSYILCYHSVADTGWRFSTGIKEFEEQIAYIANNYKVYSLSEILAGKQGVAITFDDGYEDIYTNALPILKKYRMTATVFVIGDNKNPNRDKMQNNFELLNLSQILLLKEAGWEIGFHTQTHPSLIELTDEELEAELVIGKTETEIKLGTNLDYIAYPLGLYNKKVLQFVKKAGYKAAFTINGGRVKTNKPYQIDRVGVEGNITLHQFKGFFSPLGLFISRQFMKILQLKEFIKTLVA